MKLVLSILLISILTISLAINANAVITPQDNAAKRQINNFITSVAPEANNISSVTIKLFNDSNTYTLQRQFSPETPPIPVPICPPGTHLENGVCVPDVVNPPVTSIPKVNTSTTLRIAIVGDVDNNAGLSTQVNLAKKHGAEYFVIPGDFGYDSQSGVKSKVDAVYPASKVIVSVGNHDTASFVKSWMGVNTNYFVKSTGKIDFIVADSNTGFGCTTTQFNTQKQQIETSTAWYKVFVVHHPFATVSSNHGPNGQFNCYNTVFQNNNLDLVAQAHNHNWQLALFNSKVWYGVFGTGTHDTGSAMYDCDSTSFNNVNMNCMTGTNGVTFVDFPINQKGAETYYFVSNADKLVKKMGGN